ncbi:MAG: hypothetical protein WBF79_14165 [Rhodococcus sp. (in: high G+C Gram-positive bacteria)]
MAKLKSSIKNVGSMPLLAGTVNISAATSLRPDGSGGLTFDGTVAEKVSNGQFLSRDLVPGPARIEFVSSTKRYGPFDIVIPDGSNEYEVWPLIAQYIPQPALVVSEVASLTATATAAAAAAAQSAADAAANDGATILPPLVADGGREGFFTIPGNSSIREDPSRPGVFLIGA